VESGSNPKYFKGAHYHEAGFDSYVTSKVFLRLAANLRSTEANGVATQPADASHEQEERDNQMNGSGGVKLPPMGNGTSKLGKLTVLTKDDVSQG